VKRFLQHGSKMVEVEDDEEISDHLNRKQDEEEDNDVNIAVDGSTLSTPEDTTPHHNED
jgi:hypothetical protein